MQNRVLQYLIVFSILFLVACSQPSFEDYSPIEVGLSKEYIAVFNIDNNTITGKRFDRIDSVETIEGKEYLKYVTDYSGLPNFESGTSYYRMTSEGLSGYNKKDADSPEYLAYPMNLDVGTKWQNESPTTKGQYEVEAIEDAVLFDRSYKDCLKIVYTYLGKGDDSPYTSLEGYEYLCEKEGEVKSGYTVNFRNGKVATFSYSLVGDNTQSESEKTLSKTSTPPKLDILGELTRPLAEKMLNEFLSSDEQSQLSFRDDGLDRARKDGLITRIPKTRSRPSVSYSLSEEGINVIGKYITEYSISKSGFRLNEPLRLKVDRITGIASVPLMGEDFADVEYVVTYQFLEGMRGILPYVYTGDRRTQAFQKYDDGWRVKVLR